MYDIVTEKLCFRDNCDSISSERTPKYFIYIQTCTAIEKFLVAEILLFVQVLVAGMAIMQDLLTTDNSLP
jgi:hypothetical protein